MKTKILEQLEKLLKNPNAFELGVLNTFLKVTIPFNRPHGFSLTEVKSGKVVGTAPFKRVNKNHLGGMHACALATIGEYVSGTTLLTEFSSRTYRFILKSLKVDYLAQGREKIIARCELKMDDVKQWKETLKNEAKIFVPLIAILQTGDGKEVAKVHTEWQLKEWSQVKFKQKP